ncbi:sensor histidine kinase [Streptomyces anulatus]|uniref:sensor histidine kinase n=1 Tax=Streptomyces anulatus TaxID=1892 RepID=UPI0034438ECB
MNESVTAPASRRSLRDWLVDIFLFLLAVASGIALSGMRLAVSPRPPAWLFDIDQITAALGCAALWLRRSRPVELALALLAVSTFSELVAGAMLVALFTVAVHRPPRTTAVVFGVSLLAALVYVVLRPEPDLSRAMVWVFGVTIQGAAVGWGLFVHHRRRLVVALRERTARVETEARLRAEQAHHQAREAIAREIHDVLGHRLSLLSVHAGALEYHPDAPAEDIARAATVIRESAHQALQDLRDVIGVLRAPVGELPQPTFADIRQLVTESDRAGMRVDMSEECTGIVPDRLGRTAYRIVQEALTNVRKHAQGAEARVRVAGAPGQGLTVEIGNGAGDGGAGGDGTGGDGARGDGAGGGGVSGVRPGRGLIGLAERVALVDGRLEYGATATGGWRLAAWLPWPP